MSLHSERYPIGWLRLNDFVEIRVNTRSLGTCSGRNVGAMTDQGMLEFEHVIRRARELCQGEYRLCAVIDDGNIQDPNKAAREY